MTEIAADEQDLAKALDSVASAASGFDTSDTTVSPSTSLGGVDLPPIVPPNSPVAPAVSSDSGLPTPLSSALPSTPAIHTFQDDQDAANSVNNDSVFTNNPVSSTPVTSEPVVSGPLADIKNDALNELRPLVDKLNVSPEEKFDTYLLLIRSTDDSSLIGPAHEAAKAIEDEARRAEALLDIIKEIDFLSRQDKASN